MAKKFKIPKISKDRSKSDKIIPTEIKDYSIAFNFKRICEKSGKFEYSNCTAPYFKKLVERLKEISNMTKLQMTVHNKNSLRCHPIKFKENSVSENSFGLGEDISDDSWQFQITSNKHGRVHGYFIGNVFYIVWLDPNHNLYPKRN